MKEFGLGRTVTLGLATAGTNVTFVCVYRHPRRAERCSTRHVGLMGHESLRLASPSSKGPTHRPPTHDSVPPYQTVRGLSSFMSVGSRASRPKS